MGDTVTQPNPSSLLRLFQSEMFDRWLAVTYLFKYTDAGVQHYLCQLLREQPPHEVEYYLPQLWYGSRCVALRGVLTSRAICAAI